MWWFYLFIILNACSLYRFTEFLSQNSFFWHSLCQISIYFSFYYFKTLSFCFRLYFLKQYISELCFYYIWSEDLYLLYSNCLYLLCLLTYLGLFLLSSFVLQLLHFIYAIFFFFLVSNYSIKLIKYIHSTYTYTHTQTRITPGTQCDIRWLLLLIKLFSFYYSHVTFISIFVTPFVVIHSILF